MALNPRERDDLMHEVRQHAALPGGFTGDRLDAMIYGIALALNVLTPRVSIAAPPPPPEGEPPAKADGEEKE